MLNTERVDFDSWLIDSDSFLVTMAQSYYECACFTMSEDDYDPEIEYQVCSTLNVFVVKDCLAFLALAYDVLVSVETDASQLGHDLWLSRNGHGAGFFDRDYADSETLEHLQDIAQKLGERYLMIGDGDIVYYAKG